MSQASHLSIHPFCPTVTTSIISFSLSFKSLSILSFIHLSNSYSCVHSYLYSFTCPSAMNIHLFFSSFCPFIYLPFFRVLGLCRFNLFMQYLNPSKILQSGKLYQSYLSIYFTICIIFILILQCL